MKKFLTVLLVIAVMFTFSFSSAFATTNYTPKTESLEAATKYLDSAMATAAAKEALGTTYSDEVEEYASKYIANQSTIILSALMEYYNLDDSTEYSNFVTEVNKWVGVISGTPDHFGKDTTPDSALEAFMTSYASYYATIAGTYGMGTLKEAAVAQLEAIDTTVYTEKVGTYNYDFDTLDSDLGSYTGVNKEVSGQKFANDLIAEYIDVIKAIDTTNPSFDTYSELKGQISLLLYGGTTKTIKDYASSGCLYGILDTITTKDKQSEADGAANVDLAYSKAQVNYYMNVTVLRGLSVEKGDNLTDSSKTIQSKLLQETGVVDGTTKINGVMVYDSTNKVVCGVKVASLTSLTAAEASAINAQLAAWVKDSLEVLDVYFDELEVTATNYSTIYSSAVTLVTATTQIDDLFVAVYTARDKYDAQVTAAAAKKAAYNLDGAKRYDDAAIDEALAKDKADIYGNVLTVSPVYKNYVQKVPQTADEVAAAIVVAQKKFGTLAANGYELASYASISYTTPITAEADKKYCEDFYAAEVKGAGNDYREIADDTVEALYDAKTVDEVNAIMAAADAKLAELRTAAQEAALKASDVTKYDQALTAYVTEAQKLMTTTPAGKYRAASFTDVANTYSSTVLQSDGTSYGAFKYAKDAADLEKLYQEAKAEIAAIKTDKELTAMAEDVVKLINALPATATLENDEAYMAAYKAMKDYLDLPGTATSDINGYLVFASKMATLKTAQQLAITKAINDLPTVATVDNKAKVEAARALYDKYYDFYDQFDETITPVVDTAIKTAEGQVKTSETDAVILQINKLTENSTADEIAAARAAFDALTGSQQRAVVAAAGAYKLSILEKAFDEEAAKAYVQDLGIKARSTKTSKGVKVTIKADVKELLDNGYTVEYKFYRSTKSNKGFKAMVTKTTGTYTNTKGVKGTKYYYKAKLVVKNAAGEVVATTPLTQCLYATRTF